MRVLCIQGHEGILEEGEVYTVMEETPKGNYLLFEVNPPEPYQCFNSGRFIPLNDMTEEEMSNMEVESFQN
jgi:hypothetical protein